MWTLVCPFDPNREARYREIHTYDEVITPTRDASGQWVAQVHTDTGRRVLENRYGFRLQRMPPAERHPPHEPEVEKPEPPPLEPEESEAVVIPPDGWAESCWFTWSAAREGKAHPARRDSVLPVLRADLFIDDLVAAKRAEDIPDMVAIVLTVTGWSELEEKATIQALDAARRLGNKSHVVLVQNDERAHKATKAWNPPKAVKGLLRRRYIRNAGFAASCNEGLKGARTGDGWVLFTQADAVWTSREVSQAAVLSDMYSEAQSVPRPVVGPSGGVYCGGCDGAVQERGRNIKRQTKRPIPVDFITGYWVLVDRKAAEQAGGWDSGFFLYYEDIDFSFRLAETGTRAIVWTDLDVNHDRGSTIRAHFTVPVRESVRDYSRSRFLARWGR